MSIKKRINTIVELTIQDYYSHLRYTDLTTESLIELISEDLLLLEDIEDLSTIEISVLTLEQVNSLDLVNLEMIIEKIANSLKDSEYKIIHITIPKIF
jgi:hypothetical protein